jgi:hypothetical protein
MFAVTMVAAYQTYLGLFRIALVGRVLLYAWVCWSMYRGRPWARKVFLVLMGIAALNSAWVSLQHPDQVMYVVYYFGLAAVIVRSPSVRAYFAAPRPFSDAVRG